MLSRLVVATVFVAVVVGWAYWAIQPPPPLTCGSPNGPPVTSPRIQLRDGRHLAYKEAGTPKSKAKHKIILVHGFGGSKDSAVPASQELVEELGVYFLSFDRAGYGESDPNAKRSVRSEAMDIEELADQLEIGPKFYLIGVSLGAYPTWGCLKYIPHRLAGVALVVPAINYWWPSFPADLAMLVFRKLPVSDQRTLWIAHHAPSLLYGWMTQKWLPTLSAAEGRPDTLTQKDQEVMRKMVADAGSSPNMARQQGDFESLHRDMIVAFGNWEFDPMNLSNPIPDNEGSVHMWHGYKDKLVPVELNRYVAEKHPWIHYHENPEGGHLFLYTDDWADTILKLLLLGEGHNAL